jgi:tRNA (guanine6-N2)-methyltransferase
VLWDEITARYAAASGADRSPARELARRAVPGRAGLVIFSAARADPLRLIRTAEDVFAVTGYRSGLKGETADLDRIRAVAREAPYVEVALAARVRILPGSRAGRRLSFRVVARMVGDQEFRRVDLQRAIERGVSERGDHTWRLTEGEADVEFWATMIGGEVLLAMRLSDERMRYREYKVAHMPGSLRPAAAAALAWLSEPAPDDVVLDPLCGAGTVLIERAQLGRYSLLIGGDHDPAALAAARENIGPRYKPIELHQWDAVALALPDASVSKVVTNLPWGVRHGSHEENRRLYPRLIAEFKRVVRKGGLIVMLTGETRLMGDLITRGRFRPEKIVRVTILGAPATVYVSRVA